MPDKWVVSWERTAFVVPMGGRNIQPRPERKAFDSQKEAVNFAMSLDDAKRRTAQLHLPSGDSAYPHSIEKCMPRIKGAIKNAEPESPTPLFSWCEFAPIVLR